ncbi:probable sucrose-phosphate synthase 3 isoform X2 [Phaseolus vulgaris]|uniref:probable sucrose-phosphate synthase 3 isoform X2 n=1 Tax=Phaseolus vulgaris TaxID=3885 RepID=UPI0035CA0B06
MAGNEWINGYLEAILSTGASTIEEQKPAPVTLRDGGHFNPTKYFVEEVVTSVDESDLYRTWIKVVATRNTRERSSRLENMCWRIWHLTRKKKQLEWEETQRVANRRWEREQGRREATEDMSEDLSEGEKGDGIGEMVQSETPKKNFQRQISNLEVWSDDKKEKRLYVVLLSLHGLVRGENMELGRDSDTGGQIKYVVELARALAKMPGVYRVDLFTRQISSPEIDWSYGEPTEMLTVGGDDDENIGESSGAYIVRIPFGPRDKYLQKELLWPYIQEFVDGALAHILNMSKVLGEQVGGGQPVWPYVIHGHYADAGDSAAILSGALNVPMMLTGHSLGRNKLEQLLKQGRQSKEDINSTYKMMRRIEAEELSLDAAELVITSTKQEIDEQWGLYDGFDVKLEKVLRARARRGVNCHGRYMPRMAVIPPGMDFSNVMSQEDGPEADGEIFQLTASVEGSSPKAVPSIWAELMRFFRNPHKPVILALSRPDPKKNLTTLLKAFGESRPLRELANLAAAHGLPMVATKNGGPVDIHRALNNGLLVDPHDQQAITDALIKLLSDKNLWHECRKNGWKNIHLFSWPEHCRTYLTRVAACRMRHPQWQTNTPGNDINAEESFNDSLKDVQDMSLRLSIDADLAGLGSGSDMQDQVKRLLSKMKKPDSSGGLNDINKLPDNVTGKYPLLWRRRRLIVIALDIYDDKGAPDKTMIQIVQTIIKAAQLDPQNARVSGFALSTAMPMLELVEFLKSGNIQANDFDVLICSSGSEVYYPGTYSEDGKLLPDPDYEAHIDYRWGCEGLKKTIWNLMNIAEGGEKPSSPIVEDLKSSNAHCISYKIKDLTKAKRVDDLRQKLRMRGLRCHPMYCRGSSSVQVIPLLASRAQALRYLFVRWGLNVANMFVFLGETGDTDYEELISGTHKTIIMKGVVSNGSEAILRGPGSYLREDVVPNESPLVACISETTEDKIANTLNELSKSGMM